MKKLLTIVLILYSIGASSQVKNKMLTIDNGNILYGGIPSFGGSTVQYVGVLDTTYVNKWSGISCAVIHADGVCNYGRLFGVTIDNTITEINADTSRLIFQVSENKPIITIRPEKKNGEYEFQIDKSKIYKGIIWTSDSTFILKRKP